MNIASIDIGSSSVILLIAEVDKANNRVTPINNYYTTPRISRNLTLDGLFDASAILRLKEVLKGFKGHIADYNVETTLAVGTAAFRKARNTALIIDEIRNELGINIRILSGEEEALFTFLGVTSIYNSFEGYIIDIGGASTEVIIGNKGKPESTESFKFGAVSLFESLHASPPIGPDKIEKIKKFVRTHLAQFNSRAVNVNLSIAVAGTPTTLACMDIGIKEFDEIRIEGYKLTGEKIADLITTLSGKSSSQILEDYGAIVEGREDVILTGAIILSTIMEILGLNTISVSTRGLRHGVITDYLSSKS